MGCQESLEFLLNLSRKELQGLCKMHNLPANRSHVQLAKSLALLFKRQNANTKSSKVRSSNPGEASLKSSSLLESKSKESVYPPVQMTRDFVGAYERTDDSYRSALSIKEMMGDEPPHSQTGSQLEIKNNMDIQTLIKAYDAAEEAVRPYPINSRATEGLGIRPLMTSEVQEYTRTPQLDLECHDGITRNETHKSSPMETSGLNMRNHAARNIGPSSFALVPCKHKRIVECSIDSGLVSSDEISTKVLPSFQFSVMSEEGIHLYVDLNSSPSEWINSLKDEVSICQKAEHHHSRTISNHIRGVADVSEHTKIASRMEVDIQGDGVERNTGCTNSSLSSVVSENCHSVAYAPDGTSVTSRSFVLMSSSTPVEISGCSEENQVILPSTIAYANVQNQMASDVASCPSVNIATIESNNVEASLLGNTTPLSISENHNLLIPDQRQNKMDSSDFGDRQTDGSACQVSEEKGLMEVLLGVASQQNSVAMGSDGNEDQ